MYVILTLSRMRTAQTTIRSFRLDDNVDHTVPFDVADDVDGFDNDDTVHNADNAGIGGLGWI